MTCFSTHKAEKTVERRDVIACERSHDRIVAAGLRHVGKCSAAVALLEGSKHALAGKDAVLSS